MRQVLDKGFVRLVNHNCMMVSTAAGFTIGGDLAIVRSARVSHDADWRSGADSNSDYNLIRYLMKNHHTSPFEAVQFTFEVKAPLFVFREWHRHRTWSYNEVSARYTELPEDFYVPANERIAYQSKTNKQGSGEPMPPGVANDMREQITYQCVGAFAEYRKLLEAGVARELARIVLPLATYSRMFATVDLHNLFHFLELRLHMRAQSEIRKYAKAILEEVWVYAPIACEAFAEFRLTAQHDWTGEDQQEVETQRTD